MALVFEAWRQYEDDSRVGAESKARAIIAAVDAQHPAPALPRDVAMRTDEEREAMDAVVEAALRRAARTRAFGRAPVTIAERDAWNILARETDRACDRLLAIRARRGAK